MAAGDKYFRTYTLNSSGVYEVNEIEQLSTAAIADGSVTTAKLADLAVTAAKLAADAVTTAKILDLNVTTGKIAALAVTDAKLAADSVTTAKILDLNVTTGKIADDAVTAAKLATGSVTSDALPNYTIFQEGVPFIVPFTIADGATGDVGSFVATRKYTIMDCFVRKSGGAGGAGDLFELEDTAGGAGTNIFTADLNGTADGDALNVTNATSPVINSGASVFFRRVKGAGNVAVNGYLVCIPTA